MYILQNHSTGQSYDCPTASEATLKDKGKYILYITWLHKEKKQAQQNHLHNWHHSLYMYQCPFILTLPASWLSWRQFQIPLSAESCHLDLPPFDLEQQHLFQPLPFAPCPAPWRHLDLNPSVAVPIHFALAPKDPTDLELEVQCQADLQHPGFLVPPDVFANPWLGGGRVGEDLDHLGLGVLLVLGHQRAL